MKKKFYTLGPGIAHEASAVYLVVYVIVSLIFTVRLMCYMQKACTNCISDLLHVRKCLFAVGK